MFFRLNKCEKSKKIIKILLFMVIIGVICVFLVNTYMKTIYLDRIVSQYTASQLPSDCILVLGAGVYSGGSPTPMLKTRLDTAIQLYKARPGTRIIMSGDHGGKYYDEVNAMKKYAIAAGVPSQDIFMDHAGFSTYESMFRAKEIFGVKSAVVITQLYHMYRALYDANKLGINAYGVATPYQIYGGESYYEAREILARMKDFFMCIIKPSPSIMGEAITVDNGDVTND